MIFRYVITSYSIHYTKLYECVKKGIIKGTGISIDSTHTAANTGKLVPERIMKRLAKKIFKNLNEENGMIPDNLNSDIPSYKEIEDPKIAKETMKNYLEKLIDDIETTIAPAEDSKTKEVMEKAKKILSSPKFIEQKGIRSLVDEEARVGHKTKTDIVITSYSIHYTKLYDQNGRFSTETIKKTERT